MDQKVSHICTGRARTKPLYFFATAMGCQNVDVITYRLHKLAAQKCLRSWHSLEVTDFFLRWFEAFSINQHAAVGRREKKNHKKPHQKIKPTVSRSLLPLWGSLSLVDPDKGHHSMEEVNTIMLKRPSIKQKLHGLHFPQSSRQGEHMNGTVERALWTVVSIKRKD